MTQNNTTNADTTPAVVKAEVSLIKRFITVYFGKQGRDLSGVRTNYSNYFAAATNRSEAVSDEIRKSFTNSGMPVAYLIFSDARFGDGSEITDEDIEQALSFVGKMIPSEFRLPMVFVPETKKVKVLTGSLYDDKSKRVRPSTLAVSKEGKTTA